MQYTEAWLAGSGAVPLYNLMEDAATAEISRTQVWQWIRHAAKLDDGRTVTRELVSGLFDDEQTKLREALGAARVDGAHFKTAVSLLRELISSDTLAEFLTLPAYQRLDDSAVVS